MALIDRVRERTGSELSDDELEAMIAGIIAEIEGRYGPAGEVELTLGDPTDQERWKLTINLPRPADLSQPMSIVEISPANSGAAGDELALTPADYRLLHGGRTLQRLTGGPNGNAYWSPLVRVTYTPLGNQAARDEAVIKIMQLDMSYRGLIKSERAGDYQWAGSVASDSYSAERENLLASIGGGSRLTMA